MWDSVQEFVRDAYVCEECAPCFSVARLIGRSSFGDSLICVKYSASEKIKEIISLGFILMWNDAAV